MPGNIQKQAISHIVVILWDRNYTTLIILALTLLPITEYFLPGGRFYNVI